MNKNKKYGMQLFAQTINRNNVTMYEQKDGTIPEKYNKLILKEIIHGSKVMQSLQNTKRWTERERI